MPRAIHNRISQPQSRSNSHGMCTCPPSVGRGYTTSVVSAHTKSPTHVHIPQPLNLPHFLQMRFHRTYLFHLLQMQKEGGYPCSKASERIFPPLSSLLRPVVPSQIPDFLESTCYALNFSQLLCSQALAHSRGRGVPQFPTHAISTPYELRTNPLPARPSPAIGARTSGGDPDSRLLRPDSIGSIGTSHKSPVTLPVRSSPATRHWPLATALLSPVPQGRMIHHPPRNLLSEGMSGVG